MGCLVILNLKTFPSSVYVSYQYLTCKRALKGISKETVTATRKEALTFPLKQGIINCRCPLEDGSFKTKFLHTTVSKVSSGPST